MSGWLGARVRVSPYLEVRSIGIDIVGFFFFARSSGERGGKSFCLRRKQPAPVAKGRLFCAGGKAFIWNSFDFGFFGFRCLLERHPAHDDPALSQGTAISHQQKRENFALYMMQI